MILAAQFWSLRDSQLRGSRRRTAVRCTPQGCTWTPTCPLRFRDPCRAPRWRRRWCKPPNPATRWSNRSAQRSMTSQPTRKAAVPRCACGTVNVNVNGFVCVCGGGARVIIALWFIWGEQRLQQVRWGLLRQAISRRLATNWPRLLTLWGTNVEDLMNVRIERK